MVDATSKEEAKEKTPPPSRRLQEGQVRHRTACLVGLSHLPVPTRHAPPTLARPVCGALGMTQADDSSTYTAWFKDWKAFYGKTYFTEAEEADAFANFRVNIDSIRKINHDDSKPFWASGNV